MKEYAMYLRKSRSDMEAEARGEMETLSRHFSILTDLSKRMDILIKPENIFREIVSGESISARPEVQKLLHNVQKGMYEGVFVVEVERLARGATSDQGTISDSFRWTHTKIITPTKVYDPDNEFDEEYFEFGLFMSRREYKAINRRMQTGRIRSSMEGNFLGSTAPYGYCKTIVSGSPTLEIQPDEARIYQLMKNWFLYGATVEGFETPQLLGTTTIASKLNKMGVRTRAGKLWDGSKVRDILHNATYAGFVKWGEKKTIKVYTDDGLKITRPRNKDVQLHKGKHPQLCTEEEYRQILERFATSNKGYGGNIITNPLAHLLYCQCGKAMSRRTYNGPNQCKSAPRYLCGRQQYCHTKSVTVSDMLKTVYDSLLQLKLDAETKLHNQDNHIDTRSSELAEMDNQLAELQKTESKLYDFLERGIYDEETFILRRTKLQQEIADLQDAIASTEKAHPPKIDYYDRIVKLEDAITALSDDSLSAGAKNDFLRAIIEKIVYHREDEKSYYIDIFLK